VTLTRAVQCDLTWTEDRAPVRTDPSAVPGAETEGRAVAHQGAARPFLRDRLLCERPSRPEAAINTVRCRSVFPYALAAKFQFTLNQDRPLCPQSPGSRPGLLCGREKGCTPEGPGVCRIEAPKRELGDCDVAHSWAPPYKRSADFGRSGRQGGLCARSPRARARGFYAGERRGAILVGQACAA
jgi:hypothetical protein